MDFATIDLTHEDLFRIVAIGVTVIMGAASLLFVLVSLVGAACSCFRELTQPLRNRNAYVGALAGSKLIVEVRLPDLRNRAR